VKYIVFLHIRNLLISQQNKSDLQAPEILNLRTMTNMALKASKCPIKLYFHEQFFLRPVNE